jgi:hypothetical protein
MDNKFRDSAGIVAERREVLDYIFDECLKRSAEDMADQIVPKSEQPKAEQPESPQSVPA